MVSPRIMTLLEKWQLNGVSVTDSDRVSGSSTTSLVIKEAADPDGGSYSVVATNAGGPATSASVVLGINDTEMLGRWFFNTNSYTGEQGQVPLVKTNLALTSIWNASWNTSGVKVENANPARLFYNTATGKRITGHNRGDI